MGKRIVLLFVAIFLISFVSAISPFQQLESLSPGYDIKIPVEVIIKQNQDFDFHFHLFNNSDGMPVGDTDADCFFHLYNSSGSHIVEAEATHFATNVINEWEMMVDGGNFSEIGPYSYIIQCNSTNYGAHESVGIIVTNTGLLFTTPESVMYSSFFIILIFLFVMTIFGIEKLPGQNDRDDEGNIIKISNLKYLRSILWMFEWMLVVAIFFIASNLAFNFLKEQLFADFLFVIFRVAMGFTPVIVVLWLIWIFAKIIQDKEAKKLLTRIPLGKKSW